MNTLVGVVLGVGLVLVLSPLLWPDKRHPARSDDAPTTLRGSNDTIRIRLTLAGLGAVPIPAFLALSGILAIITAGIVHAVLSITMLSFLAGTIGASLPGIIVTRRAQTRRRINRTVWPDVVDHLVSAVRSGLALPDSVSTLAHTGPGPTREAFANFESDYRATGNFSRCLDNLKQQLSDPVADRILETLRMAREVGGNDLTAVLRALASYLRQESAIRGEAQARQGWVMNAAKLGVAAPWVVLLMLGSRAEAAQAYNTPGGALVIAGGIFVSAVAYRLMLGIGRLPEDKRWFA